jgi:hypothetical protein
VGTIEDTVLGDAVGEVEVVGAEVVGLTVGQSVPKAVPPVVYVDPLLRLTTVPHSPVLL